jgi:hypothetical protein
MPFDDDRLKLCIHCEAAPHKGRIKVAQQKSNFIQILSIVKSRPPQYALHHNKKSAVIHRKIVAARQRRVGEECMARMPSCAAHPVYARGEKRGFSRFPHNFRRGRFPIQGLKPFVPSA